MREIKSGLDGARKQHDIVVLQNIPHHQGLVKANRLLLLLASSLMVIVFVLGFLLFPADDVLDSFEAKKQYSSAASVASAVQNPVLTAEINALKSQFVGLISGSIESKLRALEESIRTGRVTASLGTINDLKNDVKVLQSYSMPEKEKTNLQANEVLLKEVSQLKELIYLTLTSCGLMVAAIGGFWMRNHFRLSDRHSGRVAALGRRKG